MEKFLFKQVFLIELSGALIQEGLMPFYVELLIVETEQFSGIRKLYEIPTHTFVIKSCFIRNERKNITKPINKGSKII